MYSSVPSTPSQSVRIYTVDQMKLMLHRIVTGPPSPYRLGWEPYSSPDMVGHIEYDEDNIEWKYTAAGQNPHPSINGSHLWKIHIIGGGPMALMAAIELANHARQLGLNLCLSLYEQAAYGGGSGVSPATIASHAWLHLLGSFYVKSQPEVTTQLQQSTKRLQELAPNAFSYPPAFTVDMVGDLADFFEPLGVWYKPVADRVGRALLARWGMRLPANATLLRISDASIDVRLLARCLMHEARRLGVQLIRRGIENLELRGDTIHALWLSDGERIDVARGDQVVLPVVRR